MHFMKPMIAAGALLWAVGTSADVAVVVHPDSGAESLSKTEVKRLFLGKKSRLPNGERAIVVDQAEGREVRSEFYDKVVDKSSSQLKAYWSKLIFSGKGSPPPTHEDDAAVKVWISKNPEGLGYVDAETIDDSVKVLYRTD